MSREGVTNAELHDIIRQHVSRFVPSLKTAPSAVVEHGAGSSVSPVAEKYDANLMLVDEYETQEPGISSTRYAACALVHPWMSVQVL